MEIKNILFIHPFVFKESPFTDQLLIGQVYIENYVKSKFNNLKTDLIDFICEERAGNFDSKQVEPLEKFYDQMDKIIDSVDFNVNRDTIIGLNCFSSQHYLPLIMIAKYIQKYNSEIPIIIGGAHVSSRPNDFFFDEPLIDYIVVGEGEKSFYQIINNGIKKQKNPKIIKNPPIENLDELPPINYGLYEKYKKFYKILGVELSRGCPFNCSFCMEKRFVEVENIKKKWRSYSPKRAISEFNTMLNFGESNEVMIYAIYDPIFGFARNWLLKFLDLFPKNPDFKVWTECRLDVLSETILKELNERRFALMYGLESYSKKMLSIMNKTPDPSQYLRKFSEIIDISERINMPLTINLLINHPGETKETFNETLDYALTISEKIQFINFSYALHSLYPGTPLYANQDYYRTQYGTEFYFPEWWKEKELLFFGQLAVRPSRELTFRQILKLFTEGYSQLQERILENVKRDRKKMVDYFARVLMEKSILKSLLKTSSEAEEFLDKKKIEM